MLSNSRQIKPRRAKICDWLIILCLLLTTAILESNYVDPHYQCVPGHTKTIHNNTTDYPCGRNKDPELSYPKKSSTVSSAVLVVCAFVPWILTAFINLIIMKCHDLQFSFKIFIKNHEILARMVLFTCCGTEAVVSVIKMSVGRPRPNFYALHDTQNESDIKQSRMSFPSGHSSLSMCLLFLLTICLYHSMNYAQIRYRRQKKYKLKISADNPHSYFFLLFWWRLRYYLLLSVLIVLIPTFVAIYVACTRVTDYWHHYGDIAVGSLLGMAGAMLSYYIFRDEFYQIDLMSKYKLLSAQNSNHPDLLQTTDDGKTKNTEAVDEFDKLNINNQSITMKKSLEINSESSNNSNNDNNDNNTQQTMENRFIDTNSIKNRNVNITVQNVE